MNLTLATELAVHSLIREAEFFEEDEEYVWAGTKARQAARVLWDMLPPERQNALDPLLFADTSQTPAPPEPSNHHVS